LATEYYAIEHIKNFVPQVCAEAIVETTPVERIIQRTEYYPVERTIVHPPQQTAQVTTVVDEVITTPGVVTGGYSAGYAGYGAGYANTGYGNGIAAPGLISTGGLGGSGMLAGGSGYGAGYGAGYGGGYTSGMVSPAIGGGYGTGYSTGGYGAGVPAVGGYTSGYSTGVVGGGYGSNMAGGYGGSYGAGYGGAGYGAPGIQLY